MKKILASLALVAVMAAPSMANVFIDAYGAFFTSGEAKYQYGAGAGLGVDFMPDAAFIYRGMYGFSTIDGNTEKEKKYGFMMQLFGIEYTYSVPKAYMGWISSVMIGISELSLDDHYWDSQIPGYRSRSRKEVGVTVGIWTGVKFDVSQHVSPFIDLGYQYSYFSGDFTGDLIHGVHIMLGVRFTLWNKNRTIDAEY